MTYFLYKDKSNCLKLIRVCAAKPRGYFIHAPSKNGNPQGTLDQKDFIKSIYEIISVGKSVKETERIVIMGDFNLNPWDELLNHDTHLMTAYLQNKNIINQRSFQKCFYNPIVEYLSKSSITNLSGTYYSNSFDWGLIDFALYDTRNMEIDFQILTGFAGGSEQLNTSPTIKNKFLNHSLDHLPIAINVTKLIL